MALTVRADTFEVSSVTPLIGIAFGMDYSFLARETTIEVSQSPSFVHKQDWIVVKGQQGGRRTELAVASEGHLPDAWAALVSAGAVPIGSPPRLSVGVASFSDNSSPLMQCSPRQRSHTPTLSHVGLV